MKLIDSSVWVEFLRRKGDLKIKQALGNLLLAELTAYTCPIRFELLSGVKPGEEDDLERAFKLSAHLRFEQNDWQTAAQFERQLRAGGVTMPRNDLFVATVAIRAGIPVLCRDNHFSVAQKILGVKLKVEQI